MIIPYTRLQSPTYTHPTYTHPAYTHTPTHTHAYTHPAYTHTQAHTHHKHICTRTEYTPLYIVYTIVSTYTHTDTSSFTQTPHRIIYIESMLYYRYYKKYTMIGYNVFAKLKFQRFPIDFDLNTTPN